MFLGCFAWFVRDVESEVDLTPLIEFREAPSSGVHTSQTDGAHPTLLLTPTVSWIRERERGRYGGREG